MKTFFKNLFNDENNINEKAIIGFIAFISMIIFSVIDIVFGIVFNKGEIINEFIINTFLSLTLGCFGIASIDKFINKKH